MEIEEQEQPKHRRWSIRVLIGLGLAAGVVLASWQLDPGNERDPGKMPERHESDPVHKNITATVFWVGEAAGPDNKFIHNRSSAWTEDWTAAYGGTDDPKQRCGYHPCSFTPKENPFYFALPYNDLTDQGKRKSSAERVPWFDTEAATEYESIVKNRWVAVEKQGRVAYAQWEDVGPFGEDDADYVFGTQRPKAPEAGIDISPAMATYLQLDGRGKVEWRFIEESEVPDGPWNDIITRSK